MCDATLQAIAAVDGADQRRLATYAVRGPSRVDPGRILRVQEGRISMEGSSPLFVAMLQGREKHNLLGKQRRMKCIHFIQDRAGAFRPQFY